MEKKMENEMETGIYRGLQGLGFPKIRGSIWGVPIVRTIVFWGLYWYVLQASACAWFEFNPLRHPRFWV